MTNIKITKTTVSLIANYASYTMKMTRLSAFSNSLREDWAAVGNSPSIHTGIPYTANTFVSVPVQNAITDALPSGMLILGIMSEAENYEDSYSSLSFSIEVEYTYELAALNITVRNDLEGAEGGIVGVGIYPNPPQPHSSPYTFQAIEDQRLNITTYDNQAVNGGDWVFNDTEGPVYNSEWRKTNIHTNISISNSVSFTTEPIKKDDNNTIFTAILKNYRQTDNGQLPGNETWFRNITLQGNVTVPSGTKLILLQGITVNLNGYSLISGGGIIEQQGAAIVGLSANISMKKLFFWDIA